VFNAVDMLVVVGVLVTVNVFNAVDVLVMVDVLVAVAVLVTVDVFVTVDVVVAVGVLVVVGVFVAGRDNSKSQVVLLLPLKPIVTLSMLPMNPT